MALQKAPAKTKNDWGLDDELVFGSGDEVVEDSFGSGDEMVDFGAGDELVDPGKSNILNAIKSGVQKGINKGKELVSDIMAEPEPYQSAEFGTPGTPAEQPYYDRGIQLPTLASGVEGLPMTPNEARQVAEHQPSPYTSPVTPEDKKALAGILIDMGKEHLLSNILSVKKFPGEAGAFARGIASNLPTSSVELFTLPARVMSGASAAMNDFINSGDPSVATKGFMAGFNGERDDIGKSAVAWDEVAQESKQIIAGVPTTGGEAYQHVLADQAITAFWLTLGGKFLADIAPSVQETASNIVNNAKSSLKTFRELELTPQELLNVKSVHQGAGGKTVEILSPREAEFYNAIKNDVGGVRANALRSGTYTTEELMYPWQKGTSKISTAAPSQEAALQIESTIQSKPKAPPGYEVADDGSLVVVGGNERIRKAVEAGNKDLVGKPGPAAVIVPEADAEFTVFRHDNENK